MIELGFLGKLPLIRSTTVIVFMKEMELYKIVPLPSHYTTSKLSAQCVINQRDWLLDRVEEKERG